jgi:hypothetical protein
VRDEPIEGRRVGILERADQALERLPVHADVDAGDAGTRQFRRIPLVVFVGRDDRREVRPLLVIEREEGGAVDRGEDCVLKGVVDQLDHHVAVGPIGQFNIGHEPKVAFS